MPPSSPLSLGIDFGGTSVKFGVCSNDSILEKADPLPTADFAGADPLINAILDRITHIRAKHPGIAAIGVGLPGFVDFNQGFVYELTNVPGWVNIPLKTVLGEKTGLPVTVDNDANCMTFAEHRFGAAKGFNNVVALTLGTGIGGGLIIENQLYRGGKFAAGEIGQMSIHYDGLAGHYGNLGAAEKYVGNKEIAQHAVLAYANIGIAKSEADCTPKAIAQAAQQGDEIARQIWGDVASWLGTALSSIIWLLNPDAIVVGGGVANAGDLLFDPLKKKLHATLFPLFWEDLELRTARFGNEAGIIGSAALALDSINS
jgi:glucokinase